MDLVFQGAGTRWVSVLTQPDHPAHAHQAVQHSVAGVSCACSDVFGARGDAESSGFTLLTENGVPCTSGMASLAPYIARGDRVVTF